MRSTPVILQLLQLKNQLSFLPERFSGNHLHSLSALLPQGFHSTCSPFQGRDTKARKTQFLSLLCDSSSLCSEPRIYSSSVNIPCVFLVASGSPVWDPLPPRAGLCWQEVPELTDFHFVWQEQQSLLVFVQLWAELSPSSSAQHSTGHKAGIPSHFGLKERPRVALANCTRLWEPFRFYWGILRVKSCSSAIPACPLCRSKLYKILFVPPFHRHPNDEPTLTQVCSLSLQQSTKQVYFFYV